MYLGIVTFILAFCLLYYAHCISFTMKEGDLQLALLFPDCTGSEQFDVIREYSESNFVASNKGEIARSRSNLPSPPPVLFDITVIPRSDCIAFLARNTSLGCSPLGTVS